MCRLIHKINIVKKKPTQFELIFENISKNVRNYYLFVFSTVTFFKLSLNLQFFSFTKI